MYLLSLISEYILSIIPFPNFNFVCLFYFLVLALSTSLSFLMFYVPDVCLLS